MSYTAEQMFNLLRELHTMKAKSADMCISKQWEETFIKHDMKDFRAKTYGAPVMESYTVTVEASDGDALDEAARIIADLISCMDPWSRQNLSSVDRGIEWLKQADHPGLWLRDSVRDMMENKK